MDLEALNVLRKAPQFFGTSNERWERAEVHRDHVPHVEQTDGERRFRGPMVKWSPMGRSATSGA